MRAHQLVPVVALFTLPAVLTAQSRGTAARQFVGGQVGVEPRGDSIVIRLEAVGEPDYQIAASRAAAAAWAQASRAEIPKLRAACGRGRAGQPIYGKGLPLGRTANLQPGKELGDASQPGLMLALKCARAESDMGRRVDGANWELALIANTPPRGAWRGGVAQTHSAPLSEISDASPFLNALAGAAIPPGVSAPPAGAVAGAPRVDTAHQPGQPFGRWGATVDVLTGDDDWGAACRKQFGAGWKVADFVDVASAARRGPAALDSVYVGGDMPAFAPEHRRNSHGNTQSRFVTYQGRTHLEPGRAYFIERHDQIPPSGWLIHDTISQGAVDLGSWNDPHPALCVRK